MFGRVAAGLVHDLSHPIQNIGNSTRLLLRDDLDAESREQFRRTIERELQTLKRFMDDLRHVVKPKPIERFAMDVNGSVAEIVESMRAEGERNGVTVEAHYGAGTAGHRRRSLRARPRLPQPHHQRDPGDRARRPRHHRDRPRRRSGRDQRHRHRLGHSRRSALGDLRRLRHDQAPRPRPRPGDLQAHRRTARRHDRRPERSRARHGVHAALPGARRSVGAGGCKLARLRRVDRCSGHW